jgi:serine/threonine protein kinase
MAKPFKPEQFGRYLLVEKIATGGMAEIFNSKVFGAMGFEKNLVIKRILPQFAEDTEFLRMFITEAKLVCHLEHPNIVQVHELGEIEGQYYIAMEYVNGIDGRHLWRTLAKRKQRLPGLLALFIVSEFVKGLDYAHRAVGPDGQLLGVVHRDVSPSNILISYRGDVKIGDFGIALVQQESKTQAGVLKGKFGYMSPEQVAGMKVDHRSDIFAAGIVLAELLLGRRLFLGQSDFETLDKVLNVRLDVLDEHEGALPPEVVKIVRKALMRDVSERYQSAQEFGEAIIEFMYERRARISNETLAAFIAEHVAPFLVKGAPSGRGEVSAPSVPSASSVSARSPMVPRVDLSGHPALEGEEGAEEEEPAALPPRRPAITKPHPIQARPPQKRTPAPTQPMEAARRPTQPAAAKPKPAAPARPKAPAAAPLVSTATEPSVPPAHLAGPIEIEAEPSGEYPAMDVSDDLFSDVPAPAAAPWESATEDALLGEAPSAPHGHPAGQDAGTTAPPLDDVSFADAQFGAIPVFEMEDGEGMDLDDLEAAEPRGPRFELEPPPGGFAEGAGEELDLDDLGGDADDEYFVPPTPAAIAARAEGASLFVSGGARDALAAVEADFVGRLSSRTVTKVLFRFSVVNESGLLVLKGPEPSGEQAELVNWLRTIQARANAETDSKGRNGDGRRCSIHLQHGEPKLVSADRSEEAMVAYLMRTGILTNKKVEKAVYTNPHRKPVAALLAAGMMSPLQVSRHVTSFVLDNVLETFAWTDGEFEFYRGRENPSEAFPSGLDVIALILRGVDQIQEGVLDAYFAAIGDRRVGLNRTPPARIERFNPTPLLQESYRSLSTARSIEESLAHNRSFGEAAAVKRALYLLIECELASLT